MNILIDGDIYIKLKPRKYDNESESKTMMDYLGRKVETTNATCIGFLSPRPDYSDMDIFHLLKIDDEIKMVTWNELGKKIEDKIDENNSEEYMNLIDFLKEAEFIGRKFKRTKTIGYDLKYTDPVEQNYCTVLYKTEYAMLIEEVFLGKRTLRMMDNKYFEDKNYIFFGEIDKTYEDTKKLYQAILEQIDRFSKKYDEPDEYQKTK